ncbi:glucose-6-phosphate 1-dehydrogenase [Nakamurella panacisegetis]|uniref:Glucose-6-phosphate 1-dehydrogenase n=1 Tax=Nakamurella panacisegetis TaxID=1090615 RepID=A0A1H0R0B9_9ACTN|nr:glucose-6-phosphate dehydrogenase (NADP(+)) [Nakamurella panacisegetis]SDP22993.1 glucose-6-phosphate 1-dehydrogenase [Nakamurella panacisegetis]
MPSNQPTVFVLFGATGDLAKRMVLPAFYQLAQHGLMPTSWVLVGNGRGDVAHEDFRTRVRSALEEFGGIKVDEKVWSDFSARLRFAGGGFDQDDPGSLLDVLAEAHELLGPDADYIHYLAIPPVAFEGITKGLSAHQLLEGSRVVYEKPYGTSPESFRELDQLVLSVMKEEQVYRIDHFLGKEATQNIHVLRFANRMTEQIWSRDHVTQVQIDVPEVLDVADRAAFYDATGALRDMVVTHLFQVAAEVAMEPPIDFSAENLQDARESVLASFRPLAAEDVVLGQADGYRDLPEVADDSTTDTYAAVRLWVDTDRWHGVPFLLRSGKYLHESGQRVSLVMRKPDGPLSGIPGDGTVLSFSMQGNGSMALSVVVKNPGPGLDLTLQDVDLSLDDVVGGDPLPPYVSLIHDVTIGDRSLFTTSAGLSHAWNAAAPILDHRPAPHPYAPGSTGPAQGSALPGPHGWFLDARK